MVTEIFSDKAIKQTKSMVVGLCGNKNLRMTSNRLEIEIVICYAAGSQRFQLGFPRCRQLAELPLPSIYSILSGNGNSTGPTPRRAEPDLACPFVFRVSHLNCQHIQFQYILHLNIQPVRVNLPISKHLARLERGAPGALSQFKDKASS